MRRLPCTISLMRRGGTPKAKASRRWVTPSDSKVLSQQHLTGVDGRHGRESPSKPNSRYRTISYNEKSQALVGFTF